MQQAIEIEPELYHQRLIEAELGAQRIDARLGRERTSIRTAGSPGMALISAKLTTMMPSSCGMTNRSRFAIYGRKRTSTAGAFSDRTRPVGALDDGRPPLRVGQELDARAHQGEAEDGNG